MMACWSILEIEVTSDITTIKRAYAKQLRRYHPEDDPEGFQRVREAYERAINYAKHLKKSVPIIEIRDDNEEAETKVILRDTYTIDLKTIQEDFDIHKQQGIDINKLQPEVSDIDEYRQKVPDIDQHEQKVLDIDEHKQKVLNIDHQEQKGLDIDKNKRSSRDTDQHEKVNINTNEHHHKGLDTKTNAHINNYKKVMTEFEFMEKVKALYNDLVFRNDRDKWRSLLSEYVFFNIDTSQNLYQLLSDFLQENHEIDYEVLVLLNEYFKWTEMPDELIDIFFEEEEIIALAQSEKNRVIIERASRFLYIKAEYLYKLGKEQQALDIYGQIIDLCQGNQEAYDIIVASLYKRACLLDKMSKYDLAIADYNKLIQCYGDCNKKEIIVLVANACLNKAVILTKVRKYSEAILELSDIVDRYKDNEHEEIIDVVATALYDQGICLRNLRRRKESDALFNEVIQRYSTCQRSLVKEAIRNAHLKLKGESGDMQLIRILVLIAIFISGFPISIIALPIYLMISFIIKKTEEKRQNQ